MADTDLINALSKLPVVQSLHVVATSVLIYDYCLTFNDEISYVWGSPWNLGKVLFLATRYPAFVDSALTLYHEVGKSLTVERCAALYSVTGILIIIGIVIAEVILLVRVWALWGRSRNVLIFLVSVAVACVVAAAVSFVKFHTKQTFIQIDTLAPNLLGCFPRRGNDLVWVSFTILMGFETLVLIMTLMKAVQHFQKGSSSFMFTFFKDGILYFVFLLAISVANVVVLVTADQEYANILTSLQRALHSILSGRMLIHIRELHMSNNAYSLRQVEGTESHLRTIQFAQGSEDTGRSWFGNETNES